MLRGSADSEDNVSTVSIMFPLIFSFQTMKACIPSNFLSSMVVHNALGGECRRARSRQPTCRSTWWGTPSRLTSSFAVSLFLREVGNPIVVRSVFWHFLQHAATSSASLTSTVSHGVVAKEQIFYRKSCHLLCDHSTLCYHAHGSTNPCL